MAPLFLFFLLVFLPFLPFLLLFICHFPHFLFISSFFVFFQCFSFFFFLFFLKKKVSSFLFSCIYCKYVLLLAVGAPWRCGVLTTQGGIAGIGLGRLLG